MFVLSLKMTSVVNVYGVLYSSDDDIFTYSDTDVVVDAVAETETDADAETDVDVNENFECDNEYQPKAETQVDLELSVGLESSDSKLTPDKKFSFKPRKKFYRESQEYLRGRKIFDELENIPNNFKEAKKKKQNLTLRQILVMMNLHSIPSCSLNQIHEHIQTKVKRTQVKISSGSRVFYVSFYYWRDLKRIVKMIDSMFNSY